MQPWNIGIDRTLQAESDNCAPFVWHSNPRVRDSHARFWASNCEWWGLYVQWESRQCDVLIGLKHMELLPQ